MNKIGAFSLGSVLTAAVTIFLLTLQRPETAHLRQTVESLEAQLTQASNAIEQQVQSPEPSAQTTAPRSAANEPSLELLRLRGKVGLLTRELEDFRHLEDLRHLEQSEVLEEFTRAGYTVPHSVIVELQARRTQ